jgi:hypothetical protein
MKNLQTIQQEFAIAKLEQEFIDKIKALEQKY